MIDFRAFSEELSNILEKQGMASKVKKLVGIGGRGLEEGLLASAKRGPRAPRRIARTASGIAHDPRQVRTNPVASFLS